MTDAAATRLLDGLRAQVTELLGNTPADEDNLLDHGLDSIRLMTLVEWLRDQGHDVAFVDLAERPTLTAWSGLVARADA
jgi:bifunctional isochorismate lyase / aryl carrier protein